MSYEPIPYATPVGPGPIENDRRGGLMAFGIISILIGSVAGCMTIGMVVGVFMAGAMPGGRAGLRAADMVVALGVYVSAAVLFIWVGIDSIRRKRWVRPVVISVGWLSMVGTVLSMVGMLMVMKDLPLMSLPGGTSTTTTVTSSGGVVTSTTSSAMPTMGIMIFTTVFMVVMGVIVPAAFVWFYSTDAVRRTLEAYDPRASWTERCPLPVFGACAALLMGALTTAPLALQGSVPFFGVYLEGPAAAALTLAAALVMIVAMVLMYRMKVLGWWMALAVIVLGFASAIVTFAKSGVMEFYRRGKMPAEELEQLAKSPALTGVMPIILAIVTALICVGYLIWVRRYFNRAPAGETP